MRLSSTTRRAWHAAVSFCLFTALAGAQQSTSTTLVVIIQTSPPILSDPVTLRAAVTPPSATGRVTFYDGATVVGFSTLNNGVATLATRLLPSGKRALEARYLGDGTFGGSLSNVVQTAITAKAAAGFYRSLGSPISTVDVAGFPAVADFNGDGKPDIAVPSGNGGGVQVYLNDGSGGLTPVPGDLPGKGISAHAVAAADFNGDGFADLALPDSANHSLTILLGDGTGKFMAAGQAYPTQSYPWGMAVADFNGDGNPDLAVVNAFSNSITVLIGDGNGGFSSTANFPVGNSPSGVAVADFNGDGNPDLAVANSLGDSITVLLGDGSGGFTPAGRPIATGSLPTFLAMEDFNGDGNPDIAVANSGESTVTVLLGDGSGGFSPAPGNPFAVGLSPFSLASGDFNGDGYPDLAVANSFTQGATILLGKRNPAGQFLGFDPSLQSPVSLGGFPLYIVSADFDGDGRPDFLTANTSNDNLSLMLSTLGLRIEQAAATLLLNQPATYSLTVTNSSGLLASGKVMVSDTLPSGLTPDTVTGVGWDCALAGQTITCTRSDSLADGNAYPPITLKVQVMPSACPSAPNLARVSSNGVISESNLQSTPVLNCLTISQQHAPKFVVNGQGVYTFTVQRASGALIPLGSKVIVTDTLPPGLAPVAWNGAPWDCTISRQTLTCAWSADPPAMLEYPPISLTVNVSPLACPKAVNVAQLQLGDSFQAFTSPDSVDAAGCLLLPATVEFQNAPTHGPGDTTGNAARLVIASTDNSRLSLTASTGSGPFFIFGTPSCNLNPGEACVLILGFFPSCLGDQAQSVMVQTDSGAIYSVLMHGTGVPQSLRFSGASASLSPGTDYPVRFAVSPSPNCGESPALSLNFSPRAPDGSNYDVAFDPNTSTLHAGTVAGTITLQAQLNGTNLVAIDGSGSAKFDVPELPGVIQSASIDERTASSFGIDITGFSTPRQNGDTQVCLNFLPALGANVQSPGEMCVLKQDIAIWYDRQASYKTGSQFSAGANVSFSGDLSAIGTIKVVLRNRAGDSAPYCLDVKSGNKVDCP
jgi:uncharacterized repeat protein (TIGR01451 family)